jgi:hypothetical protein
LRYLDMKVTSIMATVILMAARATPLAAQQSANWVLLEDVTYHAGDFQPFRIFLARSLRYRAQFSEPNVVLEMRSYEGKSLPFVRNVDNANTGPDAAGRTQVELAPTTDGIIEFRAVDGVPGTATHFQLWQIAPGLEGAADSSIAPSRPLPIEFGIIATAGKHGPYDLRDSSFIDGGAVIEGCLAVRGGPGAFERLGGCVIGFSHQGGYPSGTLDLVFFEPHIRLLGAPLRVGRTIDAGVLLRVTDYVGHQHPDSLASSISSGFNLGVGLFGAIESRRAGRGGAEVNAAVVLDQLVGAGRPGVAFTTTPRSTANTVIFRIGGGWFF